MIRKRFFMTLLLSLTLAACGSDSGDNNGSTAPLPPTNDQGNPTDVVDPNSPVDEEGDPMGMPAEGEDGIPMPGDIPPDGEIPPGEEVPFPPGEGEEELPGEGEQPPVESPSAGLIGPSGGLGGGAYVQFNDSPFANVDFSSGYFFLENFEDRFLEHPGASANAGGFVTDSTLDNHDSVDEDDGLIDGNSLDGESWFRGGGNPTVTWFFNADNLDGNLPTHVGVVFTDGRGTIEFEAFGAAGQSLGVVTGEHADAAFDGGTAEDRFYGIVDMGGISSIRLSSANTSFGLELDHLQWGYIAP